MGVCVVAGWTYCPSAVPAGHRTSGPQQAVRHEAVGLLFFLGLCIDSHSEGMSSSVIQLVILTF